MWYSKPGEIGPARPKLKMESAGKYEELKQNPKRRGTKWKKGDFLAEIFGL
jgi:hypothetical protein